MNVYKSVSELIGRTPLLELSRIERELGLSARLLAKLEYLNPAGSVKDRVAKKIIDDAESSGKLRQGSVVIEPTSGNTGIGLALVCAVRGYRLIIVMPESMSIERRQIMKAYGAELVLTDAKKGMLGAIEKAEELAKEIPNSFIAGQFSNPANPAAHMETTGPEIYSQLDGKIDYFVAGAGKDAIAAGAHAGKLVGAIASICGGKGGGRPDGAMAGGKEIAKIPDALKAAEEIVKTFVK